MRNSTLILLTTILMLTIGSSIAMAGHTFTANDSTIVVWFDEGEPGDLVTSEEITSHLTPAFRAQLPDVIEVKKRILMTCCTDPTGYVMTDRVAALFPNDVRFNKHNADRDLDGGTNDAREASGNMYLGYMGVNHKLVQVDYRHIHSLKYGDRYVEITITDLLPNQKPVERVVERIVVERIIERPAATDTVVVICKSDKSYMLGFGAEWAAVSGGEPTLVPSISFGIRSGRNFISGTFGYGSFGSEQFGSVEQSVEQKLFSLNVMHFYGDKPWFGLTARILYASESVETFGEYLQNGYGLYGGFAITKGHVLGYITPGLMFFDRLGTDRSVEPSIAAGVNYNFGL